MQEFEREFSKNIILFFYFYTFICIPADKGKQFDYKKEPCRNGKLILSDTLTIMPYSVELYDNSDQIIADSFYIINNTEISLTDEGFNEYNGDTLRVKYKTLRINLGKQYYHLDSNALKKY